MDDQGYVAPYQEARDGASIKLVYGNVSIPEKYARIDVNALSKKLN